MGYEIVLRENQEKLLKAKIQELSVELDFERSKEADQLKKRVNELEHLLYDCEVRRIDANDSWIEAASEIEAKNKIIEEKDKHISLMIEVSEFITNENWGEVNNIIEKVNKLTRKFSEKL